MPEIPVSPDTPETPEVPDTPEAPENGPEVMGETQVDRPVVASPNFTG